MFWAWSALGLVGLFLSSWAYLALPEGTDMMPIPPVKKVTIGPYKFMENPMYVGNLLFVSGCAGMAAGVWNAIAVGSVVEMVQRYWIGLEKGK